MFDFCFTPLYACLLAVGGLIGFVAAGSTASLGTGLGSAALLCALTYTSFQQGYKKKKHCRPAVVAQLLVAAAITFMMYTKWASTGKLHLLAVAVASAAMCAYYVWNLTLFTPHFKAAPVKAE
ncbi:hypothetical protein FOA52_011113 [Chlamydomonas sp. UWO 241]|nr:hypothetical protein FOA52_011113 [Chlamydomonas sp. UWO 241]